MPGITTEDELYRLGIVIDDDDLNMAAKMESATCCAVVSGLVISGTMPSFRQFLPSQM